MKSVDLNLLISLDVLLQERSVTAAARRLGLSASAMSRTLSRLRSAIGDPLLVQAGRSLVPTPHAEQMMERVHALTRDAQTILRPAAGDLDLASLDRAFAIRASETFVELLAPALVAAVGEAAPHACLRFTAKPDKDPMPLREGDLDLEIGVLGSSAPEMRMQLLFRDRFVGVAREGHWILAERITPERYAACRHVVVSRRREFSGPVDRALDTLGLTRSVSAVVTSHTDAVRIARCSDLVALVPRSCLSHMLPDARTSAPGVKEFELPVQTPEIAVSAQWHPRLDADPAHRWLRETVTMVCRRSYSTDARSP